VRAVNLSDQPVAGEARLDIAGVEALRREVKLKAGKHREFTTTQAVLPAMSDGPVEWRAVFEGAAGRPEACGEEKVLFAHRVSPGARITPDQVLLHGEKHLAQGKKELTATHRMRFRVANDGEALLFVAEVDDDLIGARSSGPDGHRDGVQIFLDCRPEGEMRKRFYGTKCAHLRLMPGVEGAPGVFDQPRAFQLDFSKAVFASQTRDGGYRVDLRIPLSALDLAPGQRVVGFSVGQISCGENGKPDLQLYWSGDARNSNVTDNFGLLYLA